MENWELSKENVQPLKQGREVEKLNRALQVQENVTSKDHEVEAKRRAYINEIEEYEGDDPLRPWLSYIKWMKDTFPISGRKSMLFPVVEKCTRHFLVHKYRNDVRYLRVWVEYADLCPDPLDIFKFLDVNEIGLDHALFYEAYASYLEWKRDFLKAKEIYDLGLARHAEPYDRLVGRYNEFHKRMCERQERKIKREIDAAELGNGRSFGSQRGSGASSGLPSSQQRPQQQLLNNASRLTVYLDEEFGGTSIPRRPPPTRETWDRLPPTKAEWEKENTAQATKWTSARIPQKRMGADTEDFEVYVDEDIEAGQCSKSSSEVKPMKLRLRLEGEEIQSGSRCVEALKADPLKHFSDPTASTLLYTDLEFGSDYMDISTTEYHLTSWMQNANLCEGKPEVSETVGIVIGEMSYEEMRWEKFHETKLAGVLVEPALPKEPTVKSSGCDVCESSDLSPRLPIYNEAVGTIGPGSTQQVEVVKLSGDKIYTGDFTEASAGNMSDTGESKAPFEESLSKGGFDHVEAAPLKARSSNIGSGEETMLLREMGVLSSPVLRPASPDTTGFLGLHGGIVDPTINTQEALLDIMSCFNQPLPCDSTLQRTESGQRKNADKLKSSGKSNLNHGDGELFEVFEDEVLIPSKSCPPSPSSSGQTAGFEVYQDEDIKEKALPAAKEAGDLKELPESFEPRTWRKGRDALYLVEGQELTLPVHFDGIENGLSSLVKAPQQVLMLADEDAPTFAAVLDLSPRTRLLEDLEFDILGGDEKDNYSQAQDSLALPFNDHGENQPSLSEGQAGASRFVNVNVENEILIPEAEHLAAAGSLFDDNGENKPPLSESEPATAVCTRRTLDSSTSQAAVLQPFTEQRLLELNLEIGDGEFENEDEENCDKAYYHLTPLERLQCPGDPGGDDFKVWEDDTNNIAELDEQQSKSNGQLAKSLEEQPPMRVNPWSQGLSDHLLSLLSPPLSSYQGYYDHKNSPFKGMDALKFVKKPLQQELPLKVGAEKYTVKTRIGEGAFAHIYLAHLFDDDGLETRVWNSENDKEFGLLALKVQKPACPWEFYIYRQLDKRILTHERLSFGLAHRIHEYADCSVLVCGYGEYGTLQDLINAYLTTGQKMDEIVCMYYTIEMLHMLEILHSARIIHGDFKPDNLLIRITPRDAEWTEEWTPERHGIWRLRGLCLIDWGRSIDLSLLPDKTEFEGDCMTEGFRCTEMAENKTWTFQVDMYGLCGVVHCMLHGKYMEVVNVGVKGVPRYRPKCPLKRYWNSELWEELFDTLLNIESCQCMPSLGKLRKAFEDHISGNGVAFELRVKLMKQKREFFRVR